MKRVAILVFVLLMVTFAAAQSVPKVSVFGGYQLTNVGNGLTGIDRESFNGWDFDLGFHASKNFAVVADIGSAYKTVTEPITGIEAKTRMYPILFGPRFSASAGKVTPFVEGLLGVAHLTVGVSGVPGISGASVSENKFSLALGGGLDFKVAPKISLRLPKFDYLLVRTGDTTGGNLNNVRLCMGIVIKL